MTYRELWHSLVPLYGKGEARAVTDYVLDVYFGLSKADVMCGAVEDMVAEKQAELYRLFSRLLQSEPVQYVVGRAEFGGRWFFVRPGVLIPRPETEELCVLVASEWGEKKDAKVLDVGTGSGCIAVTLALDMPQSRVTAWDISQDALAVAQANARRLGADVTLECRDALALQPTGEQWDVIVSNPPYICNKEKKDMSANVLDHEPHSALFVPDEEPLLFYTAITRYAHSTLRPGGALYFELNPLYADQAADMARQTGFAEVTVIDDMYGKKRMMKAVIKGRGKSEEFITFFTPSQLSPSSQHSQSTHQNTTNEKRIDRRTAFLSPLRALRQGRALPSGDGREDAHMAGAGRRAAACHRAFG